MSELAPLEDAVARMPEHVRLAVEIETALVRRQMETRPIFFAAVVLAVVAESRELGRQEEHEIAQRRFEFLTSLDASDHNPNRKALAV